MPIPQVHQSQSIVVDVSGHLGTSRANEPTVKVSYGRRTTASAKSTSRRNLNPTSEWLTRTRISRPSRSIGSATT